MKYLRHIVAFLLMLMISLTSCAKKAYGPTIASYPNSNDLLSDKVFKHARTEMDTIIGIESIAPIPGKKILATGRKMTVDDKTIIKGSCWNWVNEVFNRSGVSESKKIVFKGKKAGPYVDINLIQPGDWLYYINYSYRMVEHSGIFVYWKDFNKKLGVILSYGGRNRNEPARYLTYDLKSVYYITRAIEK
jgi:hypothetical protein